MKDKFKNWLIKKLEAIPISSIEPKFEALSKETALGILERRYNIKDVVIVEVFALGDKQWRITVEEGRFSETIIFLLGVPNKTTEKHEVKLKD